MVLIMKSAASCQPHFLFSYASIKEHLSFFDYSSAPTSMAYLRFMLWAPSTHGLEKKLLSIGEPKECCDFLLDVTNTIQRARSKTEAAIWVNFRSAIFEDLLTNEPDAWISVYFAAHCEVASAIASNHDKLEQVSALIMAMEDKRSDLSRCDSIFSGAAWL